MSQVLISFFAGIAVGIILGIYLMLRRQRNREGTPAREPTARETADIGGEETGDAMVDVDRHMAHGAYESAAEIVTSEIARNPADAQLKAKLLEIYFVWGSEERFLAAFREYESELRPSRYWTQVSAMGTQLCPHDQAFTGH
ncbi:MAG: hypothetical protein QNI99_17050 [Woeseiaceae bacterium]|nr:hypothetical protein [Woeseiaceae bacterium]